MTGIYAIEIGDLMYIGGAIHIEDRYWVHASRIKKGQHSKKVMAAYNKHQHIDCVVIELCSEEDLEAKEQYWIDELDTVANGLNTYKSSGTGHGVPSIQAKAKVSAACMGRPPTRLGAIVSDETRVLLSIAGKKRYADMRAAKAATVSHVTVD